MSDAQGPIHTKQKWEQKWKRSENNEKEQRNKGKQQKKKRFTFACYERALPVKRENSPDLFSCSS